MFLQFSVLRHLCYLDDDLLQVEPYKTGAVAPDVAKRVVGKLPKERIPIVVKHEEARVRDDDFKKKKKVKLAIPAARPIIFFSFLRDSA